MSNILRPEPSASVHRVQFGDDCCPFSAPYSESGEFGPISNAAEAEDNCRWERESLGDRWCRVTMPTGEVERRDLVPLVQKRQLYCVKMPGNLRYYLTADQFRASKQLPLRLADRPMKRNPGKYPMAPAWTDGGGKLRWLFQGRVYVTADPDLTPEDVEALVNAAANKRRLQLEKAHALQAMTRQLDSDNRRRPGIPSDVKLDVWRRDGGRCVECSTTERLEFDHIIPLSMGGSNSTRNLQLLCEDCNRRKGASLG